MKFILIAAVVFIVISLLNSIGKKPKPRAPGKFSPPPPPHRINGDLHVDREKCDVHISPDPPRQKDEPPAPVFEEKPAAAPVHTEPENTSAGGEIAPVDFARKFFQNAFPSAAEKAEFESGFQGRRVNWTGTVKSVYAYSGDFVFGAKKGVRVSLILGELPGKYGLAQKIMGIASFAPETETDLKALAGREIAFSCTILKMEPVPKEIYLADAEIR